MTLTATPSALGRVAAVCVTVAAALATAGCGTSDRTQPDKQVTDAICREFAFQQKVLAAVTKNDVGGAAEQQDVTAYDHAIQEARRTRDPALDPRVYRRMLDAVATYAHAREMVARAVATGEYNRPQLQLAVQQRDRAAQQVVAECHTTGDAAFGPPVS